MNQKLGGCKRRMTEKDGKRLHTISFSVRGKKKISFPVIEEPLRNEPFEKYLKKAGPDDEDNETTNSLKNFFVEICRRDLQEALSKENEKEKKKQQEQTPESETEAL